ncbi:MAG: hypothetical protein LUH04_11035 [Clostridium sp.]|nr:hypothetical protein [Clostridium sp.]
MSSIKQEQIYALMLQNSATNAIAHTSARKNSFTVHPVTKEGTLKSGDLTLFIKDFVSPLRISAHKLLDALAIELTKQIDFRGTSMLHTKVTLSLKRYMDLCGQNPNNKPQVDKARILAEEDLNTLYHVSFEWREGVGKRNFFKTRLFSDVEFKKGDITATFTPTLAEYLQNAYLMQYNLSLFKLSSRNPHIWHIARKLNEHYSIYKNRTAGTANTLSVQSLLRAAPDIPSYEEVTEADRHYMKRIIMPLENSLEQLVEAGVLREWTYWNARNRPVSGKQLANMTYETFIKLFVHFEFVNTLPDPIPRLEGKKPRPGRRIPGVGQIS